MKCPYCGAENPEGATFCKSCGRRMDGMALCPNCQRLTPADGIFCIHCGSNRNALPLKIPTPASRVSSPKKVERKEEAREETVFVPDESKAHKILGIVAFALSCLTILVSVVFTFLIGATPQIGVGGGDYPTEVAGFNLYYYFGDVFTLFNESASEATAMYGMVGPVMGTLSVTLSLIGILVVLGFSVKAIVGYVQKKEESVTKYAALSYFVYLAAAVLFMLNIFTNVTSQGVSIGLGLDGATIAGLVLGGVFLLANVVLDAVRRGIVGDVRSYGLQSGLSSGLLVLGIVALAFVGGPLFTIASGEIATSYGITEFFGLLLTFAARYYPLSADLWSEFVVNYVGSLIMVILSLLCLIAFLVCFAFLAKELLGDFGFGLRKKAPLYGILAGSYALLAGIFELVLALLFVPFFTWSESATIGMSSSIVLLVMGALILGVSIVGKLLCTKREEHPAEEEAAA